MRYILLIFLQKIETWYSIRKLSKGIKKEVDENIDLWSNKERYNILQEDTQQKYFAGMTNLKEGVKRRAMEGSISLEEALKQAGPTLLELARVETEEQRRDRELLEELFIKKQADIKTEQDKEKMIDTRIKHYEQLHKFKQSNDLIKLIRKSLKENNKEQYELLTKEWKDKYGRNKLH